MVSLVMKRLRHFLRSISIPVGAETEWIILPDLRSFCNTWAVLDVAQQQKLNINFLESYNPILIAAKFLHEFCSDSLQCRGLETSQLTQI
jgi:hypothetical protein